MIDKYISKSFHNGGYTLSVRCQETDVDISNNRSTVKFSVVLKSNGSGYDIVSSSSKTITLKVNGTKYTSSTTIGLRGGASKTLMTKTLTIDHDSDGNKSLSISATMPIGFYLTSTYYSSITASGGISLTSIPRTSTITLNNSSLVYGQNFNITINKSSSSYTHTLRYTFSNISGTLADKTASSSITANIPLSQASTTSAQTLTGNIFCDTYNGSTLIGTTSVAATLTFPNGQPTISSFSIIDVSNLPAAIKNKRYYIQNYTKLRLTITASGVNGSSISSYSARLNNVTYNSNTNVINIDNVNFVGTKDLVITVTDTRGLTATYNTSIEVLQYAQPAITSLSCTRYDKANNLYDDYGQYGIVDANASIMDIKSINQGFYDLYYRVKGTSYWTTAVSGGRFDGNTTLDLSSTIPTGGLTFNTSSEYEIKLTVRDLVTSVDMVVDTASSYVLMNFNNSGRGIAFGERSTNDNFSVNMDAVFKHSVNMSYGNNAYSFSDEGFRINDFILNYEPEYRMRPQVNSTATQANVNLLNYTHYIYTNAVTNLRIIVSEGFKTNYSARSKITFMTSGSITKSLDNYIYFTGTSCTSGVFTPVANSFYTLDFQWGGAKNVLCIVHGILSGAETPVDPPVTPPVNPPVNPPSPPVVPTVPGLNTASINQIIAIANTYYDKAKNDHYFEYGSSGKTILSNKSSITYSSTVCSGSSCSNSGGPHYRTDGKKRRYCDCSTLVGLVLRGIQFGSSRYVDFDNSEGNHDSEFRPKDYEWCLDFRDTYEISEANGGVRTAASIGKYFYDRGWMLDSSQWSTSDFSRLQKGDIIFWDRDSKDNGRFGGISHVGICMGTDIDASKWRAKGLSTTGNTDITVMECTTGADYSGEHNGIRFVRLKDSQPTKVNYVGRMGYTPYKTATVNNTSGNGANVRVGPSSSKDTSGNYIYDAIGFLSNGSRVEIIDETSGRTSKWYKINYRNSTTGAYRNRVTGWIAASVLKLN